MRTRTRSSAVSTPASTSRHRLVRLKDGQVFEDITFNWASRVLPLGNSESIVDETPQYDRYGNVSHDKLEHIIPGNPVSEYIRVRERSSSGADWYETLYSQQPYADFDRAWGITAVRSFVPSPITDYFVDWKVLSGEAVRSMTPSFNDGNSLVNFVLELKDLKSIPNLWKRSERLKKLTVLWQAQKKSSEAYLQYMFGIAPLLSDVSSMLDSLLAFRKKLQRLIEREGKPITRHYRAGIPCSPFSSEKVLYTEGGIIVPGSNRILPYSKEATYKYAIYGQHKWVELPVYSASMRFRYKLPDMSSISNQLKAFADSLGVRPNPAIIWNATRLSFLVDWLVGIGKWLDSLSTDNLKIPVVIEDFCHSIKASIQTDITTSDYGRRSLCYTRNQTLYLRTRDIPWTGYHVRTSGINTREASLGLALFVSNYKPKFIRKNGRWKRT